MAPNALLGGLLRKLLGDALLLELCLGLLHGCIVLFEFNNFQLLVNELLLSSSGFLLGRQLCPLLLQFFLLDLLNLLLLLLLDQHLFLLELLPLGLLALLDDSNFCFRHSEQNLHVFQLLLSVELVQFLLVRIELLFLPLELLLDLHLLVVVRVVVLLVRLCQIWFRLPHDFSLGFLDAANIKWARCFFG